MYRGGSIAASILTLALAVGAARADEVVDWPCKAPYAASFAPEDVWGGPLPAALPADWRGDEEASRVVRFAADPENGPDAGRERIADLAKAAGERRRDVLLDVYAGLLEEFDRQRGFIIDGVRDRVVRAKILQQTIEDSKAQAEALGDDPQGLRPKLAAARKIDFRSMDEAMDAASFTCRRYGYLDTKLRALADEIRKDF